MSKLDQLKALGDAKRAARNGSGRSLAEGATSDLARVGKAERQRAEQRPTKAIESSAGGLRIKSKPHKSNHPVGDGVSLTSVEMPPGLIEKTAEAIRSGKLSLKRGRPKIEGPRPWEAEGVSRRTWYRRRAK